MELIAEDQYQHQRQEPNVIYDVTEGLQSKYTKLAYRRGFKRFLDHIKIHDLQVLLDYNPKIIESFIIDYIKHLRDVEQSRMSIEVDKCAILHFFDLNSFDIPISITLIRLSAFILRSFGQLFFMLFINSCPPLL